MAFLVTLKWGNDCQQLTLAAPIPLTFGEEPHFVMVIKMQTHKEVGRKPIPAHKKQCRKKRLQSRCWRRKGVGHSCCCDPGHLRCCLAGCVEGRNCEYWPASAALTLENQLWNSYGKCLLVTLGLSNYFFLHNQLETNTKDKVIFGIWDLSFSSEMLCEK